jgi:hypothetical protein
VRCKCAYSELRHDRAVCPARAGHATAQLVPWHHTGDDAFQSNTIPPQPACVEMEGAAVRAAVGAGAAAAAAAPPACGTPSASGTATSHPEREQEEEGLVPPVTATLPAGSCAAAMQLCLQCRVAPQPPQPEAEDVDDDTEQALSVEADFGPFPFPVRSHHTWPADL